MHRKREATEKQEKMKPIYSRLNETFQFLSSKLPIQLAEDSKHRSTLLFQNRDVSISSRLLAKILSPMANESVAFIGNVWISAIPGTKARDALTLLSWHGQTSCRLRFASRMQTIVPGPPDKNPFTNYNEPSECNSPFPRGGNL